MSSAVVVATSKNELLVYKKDGISLAHTLPLDFTPTTLASSHGASCLAVGGEVV